MEPEASWIPVAEAFFEVSPLEEAGVNWMETAVGSAGLLSTGVSLSLIHI